MVKKVVSWVPPFVGVLKFNVDGAARGESGPTGIGGVLCNSEGIVLAMYSKHMGSMDYGIQQDRGVSYSRK